MYDEGAPIIMLFLDCRQNSDLSKVKFSFLRLRVAIYVADNNSVDEITLVFAF